MIKRIKKRCNKCHNLNFLWAKGMCKICYNKTKPKPKSKPKKKIRPFSSKRQLLNLRYGRLRKKFLKQNDCCEARLPDCTGTENLTIHHCQGREGELFLDTRLWKTLCLNCHTKIHGSHTAWAYENGFLIYKHQIDGNE